MAPEIFHFHKRRKGTAWRSYDPTNHPLSVSSRRHTDASLDFDSDNSDDQNSQLAVRQVSLASATPRKSNVTTSRRPTDVTTTRPTVSKFHRRRTTVHTRRLQEKITELERQVQLLQQQNEQLLAQQQQEATAPRVTPQSSVSPDTDQRSPVTPRRLVDKVDLSVASAEAPLYEEESPFPPAEEHQFSDADEDPAESELGDDESSSSLSFSLLTQAAQLFSDADTEESSSKENKPRFPDNDTINDSESHDGENANASKEDETQFPLPNHEGGAEDHQFSDQDDTDDNQLHPADKEDARDGENSHLDNEDADETAPSSSINNNEKTSGMVETAAPTNTLSGKTRELIPLTPKSVVPVGSHIAVRWKGVMGKLFVARVEYCHWNGKLKIRFLDDEAIETLDPRDHDTEVYIVPSSGGVNPRIQAGMTIAILTDETEFRLWTCSGKGRGWNANRLVFMDHAAGKMISPPIQSELFREEIYVVPTPEEPSRESRRRTSKRLRTSVYGGAPFSTW